MRLVRLAALAAALTLGAAAPALAQQGPPQGGPGMRGARMMEMMFRGIDLDAAQRARVDSVVAKYRAEMPAFTPGQPPDSAAREQRREIMERQHADLRALLTPDQQKQLDQNVAEMRQRMQRRP